MSPLENYTRNVARRWRVVIAFAVLGAALAVAWSLATSRTTWTATAALTTQSQERAPEQDAVLALGYVNYFNQASYQQLLRSQVRIPPDVTLEAQTGATSPILYITATAESQKDARDAAALATETFREDVRASLVEERRRAAADLQAQVDANTRLLGQRGYNEAVVLDQVRSLQGRITDIQADNTNLLKQLQPEPGLESATPSPVLGIIAGTSGGAMIGILVALLLAFSDRRLRSPTDVRLRTGLDTLAELKADMDAESQGRVAATVINALSMTGSKCQIVLAVAAPRRTDSIREVAMQLAFTAVGRRAGALLVRADLRDTATATQGPAQPGLVDILEGRRDVRSATSLAPNGVSVLAPGYARGRHLQSLLDPDTVVDLVNAVSELAGVVVVELPPILEAAEAQVLGAAAERVVLVVERGVTSTSDVVAARRMLDSVGATPVGVIIVDPAIGRRAPGELPGTASSKAVTPVVPPAATGPAGYGETGLDSLSTVRLMRNGTAGSGTDTSNPASNGTTVNGTKAVGAEPNGATASGATTNETVASKTAQNGAGTKSTANGATKPQVPGANGRGTGGAAVDGKPVDEPKGGSNGVPSQRPQPVDVASASGTQAK